MAGKTIAIKDFIGDFTNDDSTTNFQSLTSSSYDVSNWKNRCMRRDEFYANGGIVYNCSHGIYESNRLVVPNALTDVSTEYAGFARFQCLYNRVILSNEASRCMIYDFPYLEEDPTIVFKYYNSSIATFNALDPTHFTDFIGLEEVLIPYNKSLGRLEISKLDNSINFTGVLHAWIGPVTPSGTVVIEGAYQRSVFTMGSVTKKVGFSFNNMFWPLQPIRNNTRSVYSSPDWGIEFGNASNQMTLGFHILLTLNTEGISTLSNNEDQQLVIVPIEIPLDSSENIEKAKMYGYDESENLEVYEMTFVFDESKAIEIPEEEIIIIEESLDSSII